MERYLIVKLSDVEENREFLSTIEGDEVECISIENLIGLGQQEIKDVYTALGYFGLNWHIDDIIDKAEEMGYKCSEEDAFEIADRIMGEGDCNYGITWDTLENEIEDYFGNGE